MELFRRLNNGQSDTWGHFIVGFLVVSGLYLMHVPLAFCFLIAVVLGAVKEGYDRRHPTVHTADPVDFYATALGAFVSVDMHIVWEYFFI